MATYGTPSLAWPWRRAGWRTAWDALPDLGAAWADTQASQAAHAAAPDALTRAAVRLAHHLARDPAWNQAVAPEVDWLVLERTGLIDDGAEPATVADWFDTHLQPDMSPWPPEPAEPSRQDLVLLATGAYAPAHDGHVTMMEAAVTDALARGYHVRAVVFSPSHDSYVGTKSGADAWPASTRIEHLQQAVRHLGARLGVPVLVDPWEALGVDTPVNFTTVAQRWARAWHRAHPAYPLRVGLVIGADNAGFARVAHANQPVWVVRRPGWELPELPPHAHAVDGQSTAASRQLRLAGALPRGRASHQGGVYAWRDDLAFALAPWERHIDRDALWAAGTRWRHRVIGLLTRAMAPWPLYRVDVYAQQRWLARISQRRRVLSLDPVTGGTAAWPLARSRRFTPAGAQLQPRSYGLRPDTDPAALAARLGTLPEGPYWLLDDDIASGGTMRAAEASLPPQARLRGKLSLLAAQVRGRQMTVQDVVDLRDFLPGSQEGGLVVCFPDGQDGRLPYMAPYVNLVSRASVLPRDVLPLSIELWEAAAEFFKGLPRMLTVADGSAAFVRALAQWNVPPTTPMAAWCTAQAAACRARWNRDGHRPTP